MVRAVDASSFEGVAIAFTIGFQLQRQNKFIESVSRVAVEEDVNTHMSSKQLELFLRGDIGRGRTFQWFCEGVRGYKHFMVNLCIVIGKPSVSGQATNVHI